MRIQGGKVQQNGAILLVESNKLDLRPLDKDPKLIKPIWGGIYVAFNGIVLKGGSIGLDQNMKLKGDLLVWRTKMQARV
jgi:hypothetical protein